MNTLSVDSGADERLRACVAWYPSGLFGLCSDTASEGLATSRGSCLIHALHLGGETCILQLLPWGPAAPSRLPFPYTLPVFEGTRACEQQRRDEKGKAGREEEKVPNSEYQRTTDVSTPREGSDGEPARCEMMIHESQVWWAREGSRRVPSNRNRIWATLKKNIYLKYRIHI